MTKTNRRLEARLHVFGVGYDTIAQALAGQLAGWPEVGTTRVIGRQEALAEFRRLSGFGEALDLLGENPLPVVILFSSVVGAVLGIALILVKGRDHNQPMPFGPFLAAAGWITLLWGNDILSLYLK